MRVLYLYSYSYGYLEVRAEQFEAKGRDFQWGREARESGERVAIGGEVHKHCAIEHLLLERDVDRWRGFCGSPGDEECEEQRECDVDE